MATIRTAIQIQDGLSQAFRSMNVAMQATINSFEHLQQASGNAVDISSIEIARRELARAESAFNDIENQIREADHQQDRFNNSIRDGTGAANALLSKMLALVGTYLSLKSIVGIVAMSDEMTNTTARLNLINDGLQTTAELQRMIYESAQRTYAPYQATADAVGKLGMQARDAFSNNQEIIAFAEQLNKTFSIAGTSAQGVESVMLQLTQAMAAGRLQGEELNAVLDNAQPIVSNIQRYLEDAFNIDASNIKKLASDGVITAQIIKDAMFYAAEETNAAFESMPVTWEQNWTKMKNYALDAFSPILSKVNEIANSNRMQELMGSIANALYKLATIATFVFDIMSSGVAFVYDNWSIIAPVIGTATAAMAVYTGALVAMKLAKIATVAWTVLSTTVTLIYAAAMGTGSGATWSMVAAVWGLNTALAANPIFIIIMAIVALIGVIYIAVGAINHFSGTSISATGIVAGLFLSLGATIYNVIAFLWNYFAAIVEFWANVWFEPTYTIKRLFGNLANNAIDMGVAMVGAFDSSATNLANMFISGANMAIRAINWVIEALNNIPGLDIGTVGEFEQRHSLVADYSGLKNKVDDWVGEAPADYWEAPKMEMKNLGAAWDKGHNWGDNLFGSKDQWQGPPEPPASENWNDILNSLGDNPFGSDSPAAKQTAGNTAKMAKSMDGTANELKYLRDLAERETINRFTTAQIKVDMKNENHINSEMDIDGIIDRFGEKVEEYVEILAEGGEEDL